MIKVETSYGIKTSYSDLKKPIGTQRSNSKLKESDVLLMRSKLQISSVSAHSKVPIKF